MKIKIVLLALVPLLGFVAFSLSQKTTPVLLFEDSGNLRTRQSNVLYYDGGERAFPYEAAADGYEYQGMAQPDGQLIYVRNSAQFDDGDQNLVETAIMLGNEVLLESTQVTPRWYLPRLSPSGDLLAVIGEERTTPTDTLIFDSVLQLGSNLVQALTGISENAGVVDAAAQLAGQSIRDQHIYVLDLKTGGLIRLPRPNGSFWAYTPVWVSDTSLIYVTTATYIGLGNDYQLVMVSGIGTSTMSAEVLAEGSDPDAFGNLLLFRREDLTYRLDLSQPELEAVPLIDGVCARWATGGAFYTVVYQGNLFAVHTHPQDENEPTMLTTHGGIRYTDDELTCPEPAGDRIAYAVGTKWDELALHVLTLEVSETEVQPVTDTTVAWSIYGPFTWAFNGITLPVNPSNN